MKIVAHRSPAVFLGLLTLALLALFVLAAGCSDDEPNITYPEPPKAPSKIWMYDVFGTTGDNVYACGYGGAMFHFDGTVWTEVDLGTTRNVVSIWGPGDGTLYACGGGGKIWRDSGGGWNSMDTDVTNYLVGIGSFYGNVHVGGTDGALLKLSGGSWNSVNSSMIVRDPSGAPLDTLSRTEDIESFVTVNHYFVGGAYRLEGWDEDEVIGTEFTDGMVVGPDLDYPDDAEYGRFDWQLRPLRGDEIAYSEWIQASTSDNEILGNNYIGTTEGWVFQLSRNDQDRLVWAKEYPRITSNPRSGINERKGSACRNPLCHYALDLFGEAPAEDAYVESLRDLLVRHAGFQKAAVRRPIPHESWYAVSGYFYLYGHAYAAYVLQQLPEAQQRALWPTLVEAVMVCHQPDGSFWDYPLYSYHKPYGTAFALIALTRALEASAG